MDKVKDLDLSYREDIKHETIENIKESDKLGVFKILERFWNIISEGKNPSKTNLIEGGWGTGKTACINMLLKIADESTKQDNSKYKKMIPIFFTPWYITDPKEFYQSFFDAFVSPLIQYRYSENLLNSVEDLLKLVDVDYDGVKMVKNFMQFFFGNSKKTINESLKNIIEVIKNEYIDCLIIICIDEIDRLKCNEMHEITKILDFCKQISERSENVYSIMGWATDNSWSENTGGEEMVIKGNRKYMMKFFDEVLDLSGYEFKIKQQKFIEKELSEYQGNAQWNDKINRIIQECRKNKRDITIRNVKRILYKTKIAIEQVSVLQKHSEYIASKEIVNSFSGNNIVLEVFYWYARSRYQNILTELHGSLKNTESSSAQMRLMGVIPVNNKQDGKEVSPNTYQNILYDNKVYSPSIHNLEGMYFSENDISKRYNIFKCVFQWIECGSIDGIVHNLENNLLYAKIASLLHDGNLNHAIEITECKKEYIFQGYAGFHEGRNGILDIIEKYILLTEGVGETYTPITYIEFILKNGLWLHGDNITGSLNNINDICRKIADLFQIYEKLSFEDVKKLFGLIEIIEEPIYKYKFYERLFYRSQPDLSTSGSDSHKKFRESMKGFDLSLLDGVESKFMGDGSAFLANKVQENIPHILGNTVFLRERIDKLNYLYFINKIIYNYIIELENAQEDLLGIINDDDLLDWLYIHISISRGYLHGSSKNKYTLNLGGKNESFKILIESAVGNIESDLNERYIMKGYNNTLTQISTKEKSEIIAFLLESKTL